MIPVSLWFVTDQPPNGHGPGIASIKVTSRIKHSHQLCCVIETCMSVISLIRACCSENSSFPPKPKYTAALSTTDLFCITH